MPSWTLDPELRALLVCPVTRGPLVEVERGLLSVQAGVVYPVVDGVPWMLEERAKKATPEELAQAGEAR